MSQRGLEALLRPKSIAVIGASMKPQRAGYLTVSYTHLTLPTNSLV